jgi:hypothetical protein
MCLGAIRKLSLYCPLCDKQREGYMVSMVEGQWMDHFHLLCKEVHAYQNLHLCAYPTETEHSDHPCPCAIILMTQRTAYLTSLCSIHGRGETCGSWVDSGAQLTGSNVLDTSISTDFPHYSLKPCTAQTIHFQYKETEYLQAGHSELLDLQNLLNLK